MSLLVLDAGLHALLVDAGRPDCRSLGVPVGGAADRAALRLGNALLRNPPGAAALEVTLSGPTLRAERALGAVLFGAPFELSRNGEPLAPGRPFRLRPGDTLRIAGTPRGARAYLCVAGGFDAPLILGSRSGLEPVRAGQRLACPESGAPARFPGFVTSAEALGHDPAADGFRTLDGPQADWFDAAQFYGQTFAVMPASNRMGVRLRGAPLTRPDRELVSEPVSPGAVQVTNDGQCILLGADGQTIGGYPKVAHVIRADRDALAQLRPGDAVRFRRVRPEEAEAASRDRARKLREWCARFEVADDLRAVVSAAGR